MPPPSEQDTQPVSVNRSSTYKEAQKQTSPGVSNLTEKDRKNGAANDSGGTPAVTKIAHKMLDNAKPSLAFMPSRLQSPEFKSTSVVPVASTTTSPLLDALSSNAFNSSTAKNTNIWARNIPAYSESPSNPLSLSGSPPTLPSSYDDRSTLAGWNQPERRISNEHLPSASPPTDHRRPLSFQLDGHQAFEDQASQKIGNLYRRSSMYAQQSQRYGPNPPLPHHPQAHFYGAPDPTFGLPPRASGIKPGAQGYYCGFDSLSSPGLGFSKSVDHVVVLGYEGGLDVCGISKQGLKKIVSIEDLRGGVYYAKILPWTTQSGSQQCFPLVAVVLHGPVLHSSGVSSSDYTAQAPSETSSLLRRGSVRGSPQDFPTSPPLDSNVNPITHFQTTVEVYSLNSKKRTSILLSTPQIPLTTSVTSPLFTRPPPTGALNVAADAGNIVVASGTTGEIWIFRQINLESEIGLGFRCIGKVWTTVQHARVRDPTRPVDFTDGTAPFNDPQMISQQPKTALFSLKGRWLAYSPPASVSQASLRATVPDMISTTKPPGLNTYASPQAPLVNCAVDMPEGETLLNRVAREATQAAIKGARWVGDHGFQVWNNYWNKPSVNPQMNRPSNADQFWQGPHPPQPEFVHKFPPTHGEALQHVTSSTDPVLISVLDIEKVASLRTTSSSLPPPAMATFKAPLGCSFISFAPSGLALFTASGKGEVQFVWDLMRIQHTKSSALQAPHIASFQGQHIRQIAIFTRVTPARIVDVVWTMPHGERIAMVTDRNTVHFWDLPASAFSWPPLRRRVKSPLPKDVASGDLAEGPKSAAAMATSAVSAAWSLAQPLIKRPRGLSGPGGPGITAANMTAQAGHGGKALANGISKSFGAATGTIESLYKSGENRLHLPRGATILSIGCIKWLDGQHRDNLAALVDGVVMLHTIKRSKMRGKADKQQMSIGRKPLKMELPLIPDHNIAPAILRAMDLEDELELTEIDSEVRWDLSRPSAVKADETLGTESSIPQAEIESNAPYQPFHTDRRVGLYVYSTSPAQPPSPSVSALLVPFSIVPQHLLSGVEDACWVFGKPISTVKLDTGSPPADEGDFDSTGGYNALLSSAMERVTTRTGEADEEVEQIVITTRRRRATLRGSTETPDVDEDGFFEDDCDVLDFASQRV